MDFLTHPTAVNGLYVAANPATGTPATVLDKEDFNAQLQELMHVIEFAGLTGDAADLTQLRQAIQALALGSAQSSNLCINPGFRVWQRGESFQPGVTPIYTADRWKVTGDGLSGSGTALVTRQAFAAGQTDVPNAVSYLRYQQQAAASSGGGIIKTHLEDLEQTSGKTLTVTFYARALAALDVTAEVVQATALAGAAAPVQTLALTTAWQRFALEFELPNMNPGTLAASDRLEFLLGAPEQGSPQIDVAEVQIHLGSTQTQLLPRSLALEELLCKRYYESSYTRGEFPGEPQTLRGAMAVRENGSELRLLRGLFQVEKRVAPSVTWFSPYSGSSGQIAFNGIDVSASLTRNTSTRDTGYPDQVPSVDPSELTEAHWTAVADF